MTPEDREPFALTLAATASAYREEADEAMAEGYWITLSDLPLDRVKSAVFELMRTSKFMPRASEIRELVLDALSSEMRIKQREERIEHAYCEALAQQIVRDGRRQNLPDEDIREALAYQGERRKLTLYWPGEEPWNQRLGLPRLELKRA